MAAGGWKDTNTLLTCYQHRPEEAMLAVMESPMIAGVPGIEERTWPGGELWIGEAVIRLDSPRPRCPMTTVDPETLARDPEVLREPDPVLQSPERRHSRT